MIASINRSLSDKIGTFVKRSWQMLHFSTMWTESDWFYADYADINNYKLKKGGRINNDMIGRSLLRSIFLFLERLLLLSLAILHQVERGFPVWFIAKVLNDWMMMIYFCFDVLILIFSTMFWVGGGVRRSSWGLTEWPSWWWTSSPWVGRRGEVRVRQWSWGSSWWGCLNRTWSTFWVEHHVLDCAFHKSHSLEHIFDNDILRDGLLRLRE